jgi:hypothetical protein
MQKESSHSPFALVLYPGDQRRYPVANPWLSGLFSGPTGVIPCTLGRTGQLADA